MLSKCKAVAVLDRSEGFSACGGPLGAETRSACYDLENRPKMVNIVYGLGGRDCSVEDTERVFAHLEHIVETGELGSRYLHMVSAICARGVVIMAYSLKQELSKQERFMGGHRLCAGCGAGITCRAMMRALDPEDRAVVCNATSCLEVSSFLYPYTAWTDSYIHTAFANASATASGVEAAYRVMKRRGKLDETYKFLVIGGDGGTYDIGYSLCPVRWSAGTI